MHYFSAEAGVVGIDYQDLTRQEVEDEPTGMYWWRVLVVNTHHPSASPAGYSAVLSVDSTPFAFSITL